MFVTMLKDVTAAHWWWGARGMQPGREGGVGVGEGGVSNHYHVFSTL